MNEKRYSVTVHFMTGGVRVVLSTDDREQAMREFRSYSDPRAVFVIDTVTGETIASREQGWIA
jgi:hypothetical protein